MLYMIFQYGWEPVLIQRILIGFEAILETTTSHFKLFRDAQKKTIKTDTTINLNNTFGDYSFKNYDTIDMQVRVLGGGLGVEGTKQIQEK